MRTFKLIFISFIISSCLSKKTLSAVSINDVLFNSSFLSARLDSVVSLGNNKFIAFINPAFRPVNPSPWYAFSVKAKSKKEIEIELNYGENKHRYIPKLSIDKKNWKKIEKSKIKIDTAKRVAVLKLTVTPQELYIAAQEIESSKDTYTWLDLLLKKHLYLTKEIAGKTVLNKNNYVVTSNPNVKKAIVIVARQHPPEIPGGTIGFKAFYEELLSDSKISKNFREVYNLIVFPLINPDGVDMGNWRHNANGADLNRDWVDFKQPETQTVRDFVLNKVKNGTKIVFGLDFHTSYKGPYLLVLDSINELNSKKIIPNWIKSIEANSKFIVNPLRRAQRLPYCYNWFYNTFGCEAVTYEDGDEVDRNIIRNKAKVYAREFMRTMLLLETDEPKN